MKRVIKENRFLLLAALIGILIIIIDKYFSNITKIVSKYIIFLIIVLVLIFVIYNLIIKNIIRINKIKKVSKKDLKIINDFQKYNFDNDLLIEYDLLDYIRFVKYLSKDFTKMNRKITYSKNERIEDFKYIEKIRNKTIKEYKDTINEMLDIVFKYYDENGIRKI